MFTPKHSLLLFALLLGLAPKLAGQPLSDLSSLLLAAESNWPTLAQRRAEIGVAEARQAEAAKAFRPNISAGGSYTLAAGGRTINLPLGDLLNPVYGTLNQLTQSQDFPQLENVEEQFFPNNFYDVRLRLSQPLINPEIRLAKQRAALGRTAAGAGLEVTLVELRFQVRQAYYQTLQAQEALLILASADSLLEEALRSTRSLIENGAALPMARERLLAERAELVAQQSVAGLQLADALAQLSYLSGEEVSGVAAPEPIQNSLQDLSQGKRAELEQLRANEALIALDAKLEQQFRSPRIGLQLDAGSQDFDFALNPYLLAGVSVEVPLYDGGRHRDRLQRLSAERQAAEAQTRAAAEGIALQQNIARNQVEAARARYEAYGPAISAAERSLRDAQVLYRNGSASYLELIDARNQLTRVRLESNLAYYDTFTRQAALLRAYGL